MIKKIFGKGSEPTPKLDGLTPLQSAQRVRTIKEDRERNRRRNKRRKHEQFYRAAMRAEVALRLRFKRKAGSRKMYCVRDRQKNGKLGRPKRVMFPSEAIYQRASDLNRKPPLGADGKPTALASVVFVPKRAYRRLVRRLVEMRGI